MPDTSQYVTGLLNGQKTTFINAQVAQQYGATNIMPLNSSAFVPVQQPQPSGLQMPSGYSASSPTPAPTYTPPPPVYTVPASDAAPSVGPALQTSQARAAGQPDPYTPLPPQSDSTTLPSTGNPQLDALIAEYDKVIAAWAAQGKTVNPNIELSPETIQQFLDQAKNEINPYYASQIDSMKNELKSSLDNLQRQYDINKQDQEAKFKASLASGKESAAGAGTTFSSQSTKDQQNLQASTQRSIESLALGAAQNAGSSLYNAAQTLGSRNIGDLTGYGNVSKPTVSLAGAGGFNAGDTTASSYNPTDITGSLEFQNNADVRSLSDFLQQQEVKKRTLAFTGA